MNASSILFYLLAAGILVMGFLAVSSRKIFRSAIWLLFCLVGIAGLFFWMEMEFLAAVQIIVYAGGIVVLIIFSIFLTQKAGAELPRPISRRKIFSAMAAVFGFAFTYGLIRQFTFNENTSEPLKITVSEIGTKMLATGEGGYALPFEVVSILLLAAMVGCIVIAMKAPASPQKAAEKQKTIKDIQTPVLP